MINKKYKIVRLYDYFDKVGLRIRYDEQDFFIMEPSRLMKRLHVRLRSTTHAVTILLGDRKAIGAIEVV